MMTECLNCASTLYKKSITAKNKIPGEAESYIQDKLRWAAWLIESIHQRQKTIYKVMESISITSENFLKKASRD